MSEPLSEEEKWKLITTLRRAAKKGLLKNDKPVWLMRVLNGGLYVPTR